MFGLQLNRESLGYSEQVMEKLAREMIAKVGMKGHEDNVPYQFRVVSSNASPSPALLFSSLVSF